MRIYIYGKNPFESLHISKESIINRLMQVLLNLRLRLRERYVLVGLREEQLGPIIADISGPLRASASAILHLEGKNASSPKEALEIICKEIPGNDWDEMLSTVSQAREKSILPPGAGEKVIFALIMLTEIFHERILKIE